MTLAGTLYAVTVAALPAAMLAALLSIVYFSWRNGISPMPSSAPVRRAVAREIGNIAGRNAVIVDAGSGWGTLALYVAGECPGRNMIGIENSLVPLLVSRLSARIGGGNRRISFLRGNVYEYPYGNADVVLCYLYPGAMKRLSAIFRERLATGAYVVSVCFALPGWTPERVLVCKDWYRTRIYVYANLKATNDKE